MRNDSWVAGTLEGLEVPGWLVLALRRHAVDVTPLNEREASGLGVAIRLLSSAVAQASGAERVYLQAYGENERHWHLLLSARTAAISPEHRHVDFFVERCQYIDEPEAKRIVERVRAILQAPVASASAT